jgi:hypothetical protein
MPIWVRFNPDIHYLTRVMGKTPARTTQFPAMKTLTDRSITELLEPEPKRRGPTDGRAISAVVCELADRTQLNVWTPTLDRALVR